MAVSPLMMKPYQMLAEQELDTRIRAARQALGERVVILGHHYQRDEVFRHADFSGDSLKLSRLAAESSAEYIVFCGVHFMAEVADVLSRPEQVAILPDLAAGCSMADMANLQNVERAWAELNEVLGDADEQITPVTYINSAADLKAFCGRHGGIVCTSSNARKILDWSFARRQKILFFPDQHLGRNTAANMGVALDQMVVWDFEQPYGGLTVDQIRNAKMILWKGFCSVHQMFQPEHITRFREKFPQGKVISHPENAWEVCQQSDFVGSTEVIINTVHDSAPGTRWLVGTELNLVNRLAAEMKPKGVDVHFMSPTVSMCSTMFRITPGHLLWTLESLLEGQVVNRIVVAEDEKVEARLALQRMLDVSAQAD